MDFKIQNTNINFTSRKIPRYVYHFTNKHSFQKMCTDGFLKTTDTDPYLKTKGVFLIDWTNYCKHWAYDKTWGEKGATLQIQLLRTAAKWIKSAIIGKNELVILKIPTNKLKKENLFVRSQQEFFKAKENNKNTISSLPLKTQKHLQGNTPATSAKQFTAKKNAIEFIYKEDIPIENIQQLGQSINIAEFRNSNKYNPNNPVKSILTKILQGLNESKTLKFVKNIIELD